MARKADRGASKRPEPRWDQRTIPQHLHGGWLQYLLTRKPDEESLWWPRSMMRSAPTSSLPERGRSRSKTKPTLQ